MTEKRVVEQHHETFEGMRQFDADGNEFWNARQLAKVLEYSEYRHFQPVIERAKEACRNSDHPVEDHFEDVLDMVDIGSGAKRQIAEIARATFGVTPDAHKKIKGLDQFKTGNNLRDHMTDLELIFTMLGEAGTTEIARRKNAQGFADNHGAAKEGGAVAGNARRELETKTGVSVVSQQNYLTSSEATSTVHHAIADLRGKKK